MLTNDSFRLRPGTVLGRTSPGNSLAAALLTIVFPLLLQVYRHGGKFRIVHGGLLGQLFVEAPLAFTSGVYNPA